jgi:3',5'-nucleoside bisphosphate phosphatase
VIDLHLHTNMSDGRDTPAGLISRCAAAGLTVLAVTDHDTICGWQEAAAAAASLGLAFVPGVEITAVLDEQDVHILGYFPAPRAPRLESFLRSQRADRIRRVQQMMERLAALARPVDAEAILHAAGADPRRAVGRPQIADAMIAAGHVASRDEAFAEYLGFGRPAFVPRSGPRPEEVVELIGAAGGLASLAHPALLKRDDLLPALILAGLPALEAFHVDHDPDTTAHYCRVAGRSRLLVTGGSDFHGDAAGHRPPALGRVTLPPADYERFRARLFAS